MEISFRQLPPLRTYLLDPTSTEYSSGSGTAPSQRIRFDGDIEHWKGTRGYRDYMLFLRRLDEAAVGVVLPWDGPQPSENIAALTRMLDELDSWIDDIPPQPTPQRFGNLAFRVWGKRLEERTQSLLGALLPESLRCYSPFLGPYLKISFGSFGRMDYGTGHETSFALFLLCLTLVRFLHPELNEMRHIVFTVFVRYLRLCWRLQDVYRLEPAGSHGVWGLDDSHFLPYIFGSAQLRGSDVPVNAILQPPLPAINLYFMSIMRIHQVKKGPFHEHSSQLYAIATGVPHWGKVNSGLIKMYEAEILGKRVVVQHIPLGGLLEWNDTLSQDKGSRLNDVSAEIPRTSASFPRISETTLSMSSGRQHASLFTPTGAPWARPNVQTSTDPTTAVAAMVKSEPSKGSVPHGHSP